LIVFKTDTKTPFPQRFTYPAILAVYPVLKRTALLPKLSIFFHSTLTCLSYLGRKAVKNTFFFWFIWIYVFLEPYQAKAKGNRGKFQKKLESGLTAFRVH